MVQILRRQQAGKVTEEQADDADMEQIAPETQLAAAQQLRRIGLPGVLIAVITDQATQQEDRQCHIRVDVEQEIIQIVHGYAPRVSTAVALRPPACGMNCTTDSSLPVP